MYSKELKRALHLGDNQIICLDNDMKDRIFQLESVIVRYMTKARLINEERNEEYFDLTKERNLWREVRFLIDKNRLEEELDEIPF